MTKVVFRMFGEGECIALFPDIPGNIADGTVLSYMHSGQHGAAEYSGIIASTRPASAAQYTGLLAELCAVGYDDLRVVSRYRACNF